MTTKKEIKELYEAGKLTRLMPHIITVGTKSDIINALFLLFKQGSQEYSITFESLPYSRGGKYTRHTSTLHSNQKWEVCEIENEYYVRKSSTSSSAACPDVIVQKFYTEVCKAYHNNIILSQISQLEKKLLK